MYIASLGSRYEGSKEVEEEEEEEEEEEACDIMPSFKKSMLDGVYKNPMRISESLLCLRRPPSLYLVRRHPGCRWTLVCACTVQFIRFCVFGPWGRLIATGLRFLLIFSRIVEVISLFDLWL